ncbi:MULTISPECIES: S1 family peptidase [Catenuloplanes]|uniref:Serine protease n=1 Tax=Catenuloplanes niger TaxID=587534 RepID=A0AAE3ZXB9_9ACTN|nr:serine protease [Catenuloplanes niger]MDR7326889.1 hypothetical protein [Catenuloplanes niger]
MGAWRAVVSADRDHGCGFVAAKGRVLTCAHVIGEQRRCRIGLPAYGRAEEDCPVAPAGGGLDLACARSTTAVDPAPLGSIERPARGTPLELFGLPGRPGWDDDYGRRARGRVAGDSRDGRLVQIDALDAFTPWVVAGFSGGAVLDGVTGLLVGMVVSGEAGPDRTAWLMPLDEIAGAYPWIRPRLASPLRADHDFHRFRDAFDRRVYPEALRHLADVQRRRPSASDAYYYWALALLGGVRPAHHRGETTDGVERLLINTVRLDPGAAHASALFALVREDRYTLRGAPVPPVPVRMPDLCDIDPGLAGEIADHVPAAECATWRFLRQRSRS